jgi:hypothetical protein
MKQHSLPPDEADIGHLNPIVANPPRKLAQQTTVELQCFFG